MRKITMTTPSKQAYVNATNYIMPMPLLATVKKDRSLLMQRMPTVAEAQRTR